MDYWRRIYRRRRKYWRRAIRSPWASKVARISMDGGRAQAVLAGTPEGGEGGLERDLQEFRENADANAGGEPRPEVVHPAEQPDPAMPAFQPRRQHHRLGNTALIA